MEIIKLDDVLTLKETKEYVCSNFDGTVNEKVVEELKSGDCYSGYPAWDWFAYISYQDGNFIAHVMKRHILVDVVFASDFCELKDILCKEHGHD
ncbi:hypothetical protein UFOVP826_25 [uncultured Caudovirales phage]|uniref:Uncharacterized protein n=1 Tax=uncultured Caudovirales phage TaxID=2100421 RepID=A0A6J5P4T7_9CAUD|nr:hypothetical protein UFOVP826_25 [uncultured Caudovirales phage]